MRQERIQTAHRHLLTLGDRAGALEAVTELLEEDPSFLPAQVLAAQIELGDREYPKVIARLLPVGDELPQYVASQLTLGRAAELAGDIPLAYSAFREIAARNQRAFQRLGELHPRAIEVVSNRLQEAVRVGQLDEADTFLSLLRKWSPSEIATLEGARAVAVARGDRKAELGAIKELAPRRPGDRALVERRAELEMTVGDPGAGLQIIQTLASENPGDPALEEKLAAAKFLWRISMMPKNVHEVAGRTELNRADLALLFFWLLPNVRYGRPSMGKIATDILDHPYQEEIVRVVNLGLMDVDSTLHHFSPRGPARRGSALRSLILLLSRSGDPIPCLGGSGRSYATNAICDTAAACQIVMPDDCRPSAVVSGSEAVEMIRRTLKLQGGS